MASDATLPVLLPLALDAPYDYLAPLGMALQPGDFVTVPLGTKERIGVVWQGDLTANRGSVDASKLREVMARLDVPPLPAQSLELVDWVARYTLAQPGMVLRMMMSTVKNPRDRYRIDLRSLTAGGETLGQKLYQWCRTQFGVELNEQYGQTECDLVVGFCSEVMPVVPGSIGKAVPGHVVKIIDEAGNPVENGSIGEIAVKKPDPVMFLEYWNNPEATASKYIGDWLRTGDYGKKDADGYFYFTGRADDLIESGGFRIGPGEVEACLMSHAAVEHVCVLGVPDDMRGEIVKAFIVPRKNISADEQLEQNIREFVKDKLEKHAYPREIEFLEEMPMTKTGKIRKDVLRQRINKHATLMAS